jgi:hypothetical protein
MLSVLLAADDGIVHGKITAADLFFLIAVILFAIAFVVRLTIRPVPIDSLMIAGGLFCIALGWLLL